MRSYDRAAMPSRWLAVDAGVDRRTRARELRRSWERLLAEGELEPEGPTDVAAGLRQTIVESWLRSLDSELDPIDLLAPLEADQSEIRDRWLEHPLGSLEHVLAERLRSIADDSQSLIVVSDASGLLLDIQGAEWLKERAAEMNFVEGARYSEDMAGTNGIGTVLAADHALQVFASEHFNERHHGWSCSGAPIHDPVSGRLVGVIDMSSRWEQVHPQRLTLVTAAASALERCLLDARREQDARLRRRYGDLRTRSTDLLVSPDGYVLAGDPLSAQTEPLPIPDGGGEISLSNGSLAAAEPLGQGEAYLVRRPGRQSSGAVSVEAVERAEERTRKLALEQAALRRVATLVARGSSPQKLFAIVAEQAAGIVNVPLVRLVRFDPDCPGVELVGGWGESADPLAIGSHWLLDGPGVIASVRQTGHPARVDDYSHLPGAPAQVVRRAGMRSAVASPIIVGGRLWGAMVALSSRIEPLPEDTEARLADFTELVATAIANAESRAELTASEERARKLAEEQAALRRVATLVARESSPEEIFTALAEEVAHVFDVRQVTVCRYESDAVVVLASLGVPEFRAGSRWSLDIPGLPATIYETGRPARIDDFTAASGLDARARDAGGRAAVGVPIVVDGRVWGSVNVAMTEDEPFPPDAEERLARFTELAATAVSNAMMRGELAASRARVIAAADESRRRIERDLHDGAQQKLVTLALALRGTEERVPPGLEELGDELAQAVDGLTALLEELREISRGIHPAILTEGGLGPALKALAHRSTVPVHIDVRCDDRLDDGIEVAAYYIVSEALANAAKHADASRVKIALHIDRAALHLSISDDGTGGADPSRGSGLLGLRDRVEALGGAIEVASPPGSGTRMLVEIPLHRDPA
jgi:signal transduction histidine kinase